MAVASGTSRVRADITSVDAASLMRALDMPYVAASQVDGHVQAEWPGARLSQGDRRRTRHAYAVHDTSRAVRIAASAAGWMSGRARAEPWRGSKVVSAGGADVNGRVTLIDQQRLEGVLQTRVADVGRTVTIAETFLGRRRGSLLPTPVTGPMAVNARLGGTIKAPTVDADINAPELTVGKASGLAMTGNVAYAPAGRDDRSSRARLAAGASARRGSSRAHRNAATRSHHRADAFEIPTLLAAFNQTGVPASGNLSLQGTVSGTLSRPAAAMTLQGSNLSAYSEVLGSLTANINMAGREILLSNLLLDKPQPEGNGRLSADAPLPPRSPVVHVRSAFPRPATVGSHPRARTDRARGCGARRSRHRHRQFTCGGYQS